MNEEELSRAAARAAELLNEALPRPEDCNHTFSPRFRRKMRHLLFRQQHPGLMRCVQSAAVLFLTLTVLFGSLLAVSFTTKEIHPRRILPPSMCWAGCRMDIHFLKLLSFPDNKYITMWM